MTFYGISLDFFIVPSFNINFCPLHFYSSFCLYTSYPSCIDLHNHPKIIHVIALKSLILIYYLMLTLFHLVKLIFCFWRFLKIVVRLLLWNRLLALIVRLILVIRRLSCIELFLLIWFLIVTFVLVTI